MTVNNFDLDSPEIPNQSDILYTLTARLEVKHDGTIKTFKQLAQDLGGVETDAYKAIVKRAEEDAQYYIGKSQDNNSGGIISQPTMYQFESGNNFQVVFGDEPNYEILPGGQISTDKFKVQIPSRDFNNPDPEFYVYVQAEPTDQGLTQLIRTRLYGSLNVIATAAWSGTLANKNTATTDYDFYNYVISGSGSGKLDIMWDDKWFEIDDFFFNSSYSGVTFDGGQAQIGTVSEEPHAGWKKVTILVDSAQGKSQYELKLYKKKANTSYTGDNNAANYIDCELQHQQ